MPEILPSSPRSEAELDLLWGASAIAAALGLDRRQLTHLLSRGLLPVAKVGGHLVSDRHVLAKHFSTVIASAGDSGRAD